MARHYLSDPRVIKVVDELCEQFLAQGSVNAVAEALSRPGDFVQIYPNRIHGLLAGDPTRSINTATLEAIEDALDAAGVAEAPGSGARRDEIRRVVAANRTAGHDVTMAVERAADDLSVPVGVVRYVLNETDVQTPARPQPRRPASGRSPDWSWQHDAVAACLQSLKGDPNRKAGLVVPTGGGKTRIALRVILNWLAQETREDTVVLWVTHRRRLRKQARDALFSLIKTPGEVPEDATALFAKRVKFRLIQSGAPEAIDTYGDESITLLVVDEAQHAAADSYQVLFQELTVPGLFLTATPNRADNLPIGIDEIAYTVTYRELFERGCVVEPIFAPPEMMPSLNWEAPAGLMELADFLLERTEHDFNKPLVGVTRIKHAELLYEAVIDLLDDRPAHPFTADDVAYVHGSGSSGAGDPEQFLDDFASRTHGILIGTSSLLGEGFDDPNIDAAIVTYPSQSISHLMQLAGRALRQKKDKDAAHVVQVHESELEYHFEQRWLYQDISDRLRPEIIDLTYRSQDSLHEKVEQLLESHNVPQEYSTRVLERVEALDVGDRFHVMLTGIPYNGHVDEFSEKAQWAALLVPPNEHTRFVTVFNTVSDRDDIIKEETSFLRRHLPPEHHTGSVFKVYRDLVFAMEYARMELRGDDYVNRGGRPYQPGHATTWLRYITFEFDPAIPSDLDAFLADAANRDLVLTDYLAKPDQWASAVKIELPLAGSLAYLLDHEQDRWLDTQRSRLVERLRRAEPEESFAEARLWREQLPGSPLPGMLIGHIDQLINPDRFETQRVSLIPLQRHTVTDDPKALQA